MLSALVGCVEWCRGLKGCLTHLWTSFIALSCTVLSRDCLALHYKAAPEHDLVSLPTRQVCRGERCCSQANSEVSALLGRIPSAVGYQPTLATDLGGLQERITTTHKGSITSVQVPARRRLRPQLASALWPCLNGMPCVAVDWARLAASQPAGPSS